MVLTSGLDDEGVLKEVGSRGLVGVAIRDGWWSRETPVSGAPSCFWHSSLVPCSDALRTQT